MILPQPAQSDAVRAIAETKEIAFVMIFFIYNLRSAARYLRIPALFPPSGVRKQKFYARKRFYPTIPVRDRFAEKLLCTTAKKSIIGAIMSIEAALLYADIISESFAM